MRWISNKEKRLKRTDAVFRPPLLNTNDTAFPYSTLIEEIQNGVDCERPTETIQFNLFLGAIRAGSPDDRSVKVP